MAVTMQDPSARLSGDEARSHRLRRIWAWRRPRRQGRPVPEARMRKREFRRLAAMDRSLTAEAPRLASMFTMFGQLTSGESPGGVERLPAPARSRRRPRRVHIAVLLALAVVVAVCFALSTQIHAVARSCSTTGTTAIAVSSAGGPTLSCSGYATSK
jgi:ferric-dicitrate binding protein FerR (iron transport regulator)